MDRSCGFSVLNCRLGNDKSPCPKSPGNDAQMWGNRIPWPANSVTNRWKRKPNIDRPTSRKQRNASKSEEGKFQTKKSFVLADPFERFHTMDFDQYFSCTSGVTHFCLPWVQFVLAFVLCELRIEKTKRIFFGQRNCLQCSLLLIHLNDSILWADTLKIVFLGFSLFLPLFYVNCGWEKPKASSLDSETVCNVRFCWWRKGGIFTRSIITSGCPDAESREQKCRLGSAMKSNLANGEFSSVRNLRLFLRKFCSLCPFLVAVSARIGLHTAGCYPNWHKKMSYK